MTSLYATTPKWKSSQVLIIALGVVGLVSGSLFYQTSSNSASSPQNTCIGIGGWPCGYVGPFTGDYYAGYATLGCTPITPSGTCVVPEIAMEASYLVIDNSSYVIDWANESFQSTSRVADGSTISVLGNLAPIFYNKTAGSTYAIYSSNAMGVWKSQPLLQIQNATLTTQSMSVSCTTTLSLTVSGPPTGVWNLPMIPARACYTVSNIAQQQSQPVGNTNIPIRVMVLASIIGGVGVIIVGTLMFLRYRNKENRYKVS